ncbi:MAG: AsmA family protein [Alphaproteobacteria bacterium]
MRKALYVVVGVLVVLAATVLIAPALIGLDTYRGAIGALARKHTGREVRIDGNIRLSLLPRPRVSVEGIRLANLEGAAVPDMVRVGSVDLVVALGPLLSGEVEVASVRFIEPVVELEVLPDGRANWALAPAAGAGVPEEAEAGAGAAGAGVRLDSLVIEDGTVVYRDARRGTVERVEQVNLEGSARSLSGPFRAEGSLVARGLSLAFKVAVGALDRAAVPVTAKVDAAKPGASAIFSGSVQGLEASPELAGAVELTARSLAGAVEALGIPPPGGVAGPLLEPALSLSAEVAASSEGLAIDDVMVELGKLRATGAVSLALEEKPRVDVVLALNRIDLDALLAAGEGLEGEGAEQGGNEAEAPGAAFALPTEFDGSLDLAVDAAVFNQTVVRQIQVFAALDDGVVTLQQASALLPGGSDIALFGVLEGSAGGPAFEGQVEAVSDDFRAVLAWLRADVEGVPADRLRKLSLTGMVRADPRQAALSEIDLRIDAGRLTGEVFARLGERPFLRADVALDRLNLDAYLPKETTVRETKREAVGLGAEAARLPDLGAVDGELKARIRSLTVNAVAVRDIHLEGFLEEGSIEVTRLAVGDLAGARAELKGRLRPAVPAFDLALDLEAESLAGVFRLIRASLPVAPKQIGRVAVSGTARGDLSRVEIDAHAEALGATVEAAATLLEPTVQPRFDLRVDVAGRSYAAPMRALGVRLEEVRDGPFTLAGRLDGGLDAADVDLELELVGARATVEGQITGLGSGPGYDLRLSLDHPEVAALLENLGGGDGFARRQLGALRLATAVAGDARETRLTDIRVAIGPAEVNGSVAVRFGSPRPSLDADLTAGDVDLGLFLLVAAPSAAQPPTGTAPPATPRGEGRWSREPLDLSSLRAADGRLTMRARSLTYRNLRFEETGLDLTLSDGVLDIQRLSGRLFGGQVELTAQVVDAESPTAGLSVRLDNADAGEALNRLARVGAVSGWLGFAGAMRTVGRSTFDWISALNGHATVAMRDGAIQGLDLAAISERLDNLERPADLLKLAQVAASGGTTRFASLDGRFEIRDGVAVSDDLWAVLEGAEGKAAVAVDLPRWTLKVNSELHLTRHPEAPPLGVAVEGPIDGPSVGLDTRQLEAYVARRAVGTVIEKVLPEEAGGLLELLTEPQQAPQPEGRAPEPSTPPAPPKEMAPQEPTLDQLLKELLQGLEN